MQDLTHDEKRVLVADPRRENRTTLAKSLSESGMTCLEAADGITAWARFTTDKPDLVLAAFQLPGLHTIDLLNRVRDVSTTPFLVHVPAREFSAVVTAMRNGAADVIPYPFDLRELPIRLRSAIANHLQMDNREGDLHEFTGRSAASVRIREQIKALAGLRISVLILGENGTGRDYAARSLAYLDRVAQGSLLKITPATSGRRSQCDEGKTVYLDGIEHFSRVDQAYWYSRISDAEASFDNTPRRVIVSSGSDLHALARKGVLDPDLADRLLRFVVAIPALRDRSEDVEPLCEQLVRDISRRIGRPGVRLSKQALTLLEQQPWPGNTAQLAAFIEKLVAFSADSLITRKSVVSLLTETPASVVSLRQDAQRRLRDELIEVLDATGGNLAEAARRMNMSRGAVIYRAQKFGLLAKRVQPRG